MYTILSRNGYLIELEVTCMIRKIIEKLFWHYQEKENWKMKMNEPIAIKKLTKEEAQIFLMKQRLEKNQQSQNTTN